MFFGLLFLGKFRNYLINIQKKSNALDASFFDFSKTYLIDETHQEMLVLTQLWVPIVNVLSQHQCDEHKMLCSCLDDTFIVVN